MNQSKNFGFTILVSILSFVLGTLTSQQKKIEPVFQPIQPEISVIHLQERRGDSIIGSISGPARIIWNEANTIEKEGDFALPVAQIPNQSDIALHQLPYTGNAKTNKFYPSNSYPARGVEVKHRRLFETKQLALDAGFVASKLVK